MANNLIDEEGVGGPPFTRYPSRSINKCRRVNANHHIEGQVTHTTTLSDHFAELLVSAMHSDVTLIVEGKKFEVHRIVMATRSEYFRAMLYGDLMESVNKEVELKEIYADSFELILSYIYTGKINLKNLTEDLLIELLSLTNQYYLNELQASIAAFLRDTLTVENVCRMYDVAVVYQLPTLQRAATSMLTGHSEHILKTETFLALTADSLTVLLSMDSFFAPEISIFEAISRWSTQNPGEATYDLMERCLRLSLLTNDELLNVVRPSGLVKADAILDAMTHKIKVPITNHRGFLCPEVNMADLTLGAIVETGELKRYLLDNDTQSYDLEHGFTRHAIYDESETCVDEESVNCIVVRLSKACILNTIRMLLWDKDLRWYSYYIEVSIDKDLWTKVIDYREYPCRSWQKLHFKDCIAKYIRIVGTQNTVNRVFHLVSFECYYTQDMYVLDNDIQVAPGNVASIFNSASVIEGISRERNALINGETTSYDWDNGYTCHQLGSGNGCIVIQLAQPYVVNNLKLLLWDMDQRCYSYYIELSKDGKNWVKVVDRSSDNCQSWQHVLFESMITTFIRIIGVQNTANEVFHCVHFEIDYIKESQDQILQPPQ